MCSKINKRVEQRKVSGEKRERKNLDHMDALVAKLSSDLTLNERFVEPQPDQVDALEQDFKHQLSLGPDSSSAGHERDKENPRKDAVEDVKSKIKLRPYQEDMVKELQGMFLRKKHPVLMYLPTGGGKTAIACHLMMRELAKSETSKVAMFVHRDELAFQTQASLVRFGAVQSEDDVGFVKSGFKLRPECRIHIVSIQTFARRQATDAFPKSFLSSFSLVLIDEAHHAMSKQYLSVIDIFSSHCKLVGLTATPYRLNKGEVLGDLFQHRLDGPSVSDLISQGFLVPPVVYGSSQATQRISSKAIQTHEILKGTLNNWKQKWSSRKTLVFCIDLTHAQQVLDLCEELDIKARIIHGKMSSFERASLYDGSEQHEFSMLISVDVVSEGVDTVWIDCLLLLNPTQSLARYTQQIGRGLRIYPDKANCVVLDEVGNVWNFGFITEVKTEEQVVDLMARNQHKSTKCRQNVLVAPCKNQSRCTALVPERKARCFMCQLRLDSHKPT